MGFTPDAPPRRAGDYSRFLIKRATSLPAGTGSIALVPTVDSWGPVEVPTVCNNFAEYLQKFGNPIDPANPSPGYIAVYNAFKGEGSNVPNGPSPGAGQVIVYRMATATVAPATLSLAAGATPLALTLTAKHNGVLGNQIKAEVIANAVDAVNKRDLNIYLGSTLVEQYKGYGAADITTLLADINATSKWLVASAAVNSVKLDVLAATALAGGNDGSNLLVSDWTDMMAGVESQRFGYLLPYDLTTGSIQTALINWATGLNNREKSKRFFVVLGGVAGETYSTAKSGAILSANENIVRLGVGTYKDNTLGLALSTSQLATRIGGIMSARGGMGSVSFAQLEDLSIIVGPAEQDYYSALDDGIVLLSLGQQGVQIEKGLTTYTVKTNADKPFDTYSRIKYVTTMQNFERENREDNESAGIFGRLNVNEDTREELVAKAQKKLDEFIKRGEVQAGAKVGVSTSPPPSDDDEFVALDWVGRFARSLEQVRNSFYLG